MANKNIPQPVKLAPAVERKWGLIAPPNGGKSTFLTAMRLPLLLADKDGRGGELAFIVDNVHSLTDDPDVLNDPDVLSDYITTIGGQAQYRKGTVAIDSMTAIIEPIVDRIMAANDKGENSNRMGAFRPKALAMRQLTNALVAAGGDFVIIYHTRTSSMAKGNQVETVERASLSALEEARMFKVLNAIIQLGEDSKGRFAQIRDCRVGSAVGQKFYDTEGFWRGVPEKIDAHIEQCKRNEVAAGESVVVFGSKAAALAWGFEQGVFADEAAAQNSFNKLKRELEAKAKENGTKLTSGVMFAEWRKKVMAKVDEKAAGAEVAPEDMDEEGDE